MRVPPQEPPCFSNITTETIDEEVGSVLEKSAAFQDQLATTLTPATATFANFVRPLLDDINKAKCRTTILGLFLSRNAVDPAIRQAAREAQKRIADAEAKTTLRPDLASLIAAVFEKEKNRKDLDEEDRYILAHLYGQFRRSGAYIRDEAHRARLDKAQSEISEINAAAIKCFTEASNGLWFTRSELDGCPETWLANLMTEKQEDGVQDRFWVTFRDDNYVQVLQSASKEETRKKIFLGNERQFPENIERLSRAVVVRDEAARLLGYENHATLRMEDTMMGTVEKLQETLHTLHSKLTPLAKAEVDALLALKKAQLESQHGSGNGVDANVNLYVWDRVYYNKVQNRQKYALDGAKVSEYFEVNRVISEMLKVFEELFGMEFVPMPNLDTWHETVSPFSVWDSASEGGEFLGYFFLDIFGRPGKFPLQYHSRIQPGYFDADGARHYPASALVCSYPESTPRKPSLLHHRDVRIMFHELGHAIHSLVERTKYATGQSRDFGEIPSKMLEHFIWLPEVMIRLSRHYKTLPAFTQGGKPRDEKDVVGSVSLPLNLACAVERTKTVNFASGLLNSLRGALFDLALYTPKTHEEATAIDTTALWNRLGHQYLPLKLPDDEETFGQASFSPCFRGNEVGFFTYLMSEVYAADLYEASFAKDPLSPEAGRRWRYEVLERASCQPELEVLERYLGRPLSVDAIFEQIAHAK